MLINGAGVEDSTAQVAGPLIVAGARALAVGAKIGRRIALPLIRAGAAEYFALPEHWLREALPN